MRWQYAETDRKGKAEILDAVIAATGYHRKYATRVLQQPVKQLRVRRTPKRVYDGTVKDVFVQIWRTANHICSKQRASSQAAVDRLVHHATILEMKESYRQAEAVRRKKAEQQEDKPPAKKYQVSVG